MQVNSSNGSLQQRFFNEIIAYNRQAHNHFLALLADTKYGTEIKKACIFRRKG